MCKVKVYPNYMFCERLNESFLKSGITQKELSSYLGVDRKTVRNWLYGYSDPQSTFLKEICKILKVSADYLLFGREDRGNELV